MVNGAHGNMMEHVKRELYQEKGIVQTHHLFMDKLALEWMKMKFSALVS